MNQLKSAFIQTREPKPPPGPQRAQKIVNILAIKVKNRIVSGESISFVKKVSRILIYPRIFWKVSRVPE